MSSKKNVWKDELTCKPLDTYSEIINFLDAPPPWRSLCKDLTPHSQYKVRNLDINRRYDTYLESPETFCHFAPDADEPIRENENKLPKMLVCHDMANGYHDDSYIDGTGIYDAYTFYNWAAVDIFCYFSHHLITIPPLSWINVGHAHGVKVIGTVITEWAEGITFWDKVLENEEEYKKFANALVAIAKTLKFDGWLLNVENKLSKPDVLLNFVHYLHRALHQEIPHAELIWYDSVTIYGHLNWQNGLNEKNRAFFDACDGIFTNYSWSDQDLISSVIAAGDRILDLYIGIDIWGRNFHGGGQFNTFEAVKLVHSHGTSMAIFAPAWTHEAMSTEGGDLNTVAMADDLDKWQQFLLRDRALWGSIWPFLNTRLPCTLPFKTSFCKGQGKKRRFYGEVFCPVPWYNLRHQQYQPNSAHGPHGYLLSTDNAILAVSRHNQQKDQKGIIRYPESFHKTRLDLHSTKPKTPPQGTPDVLSDSESLPDISENEETQKKASVPKRKMKNALKHLFRKAPKTSDNNEQERVEEDDEDEMAAGPSLTKTSGKSMLTMSVNLRLGRGSVVRHRLGLASVPEERECLEVYQEDSFQGGSCLKIYPSDNICSEHRLTRLFHCDFYCEESLVVCVVTKSVMGFPEQYLNLRLFLTNAKGHQVRAVLVGRSVPPLEHAPRASTEGVVSLSPLDLGAQPFKELQRYLLLNEPAFYVPTENSFGWIVRYYNVRLPKCYVTSINLRTGLEQGAILLGYIGICHLSVSTCTVGINTADTRAR